MLSREAGWLGLCRRWTKGVIVTGPLVSTKYGQCGVDISGSRGEQRVSSAG